MAYFLKKSKNKKGLYLQIYESFYDPERRQTAHKSIRALGYVHELKENGIEDPLAHFQAEVDAMNEVRKVEKLRTKALRIADTSPEKFVGHFVIKAMHNALGVAKDMGYMQLSTGFRFSVPDMISHLTYARLICPCSKRKTFEDVLPKMYGDTNFSLEQVYDALAFFGQNYTKFIEIYNTAIQEIWKRDTSYTFFDGTNFYFEIDTEDTFRKKGPSKENRHDPLVSLGLLLDRDCIPLTMELYAGNESEIPHLAHSIASMKRKGNIAGRTIRVADKGLNCAANIQDALISGDGYLFSKSIKKMSDQERCAAIGDIDNKEVWCDVYTSQGELSFRYKEVIDDFDYSFVVDGKKTTSALREKRIVTYNPSLARKQLREIDRMVEKARALRMSGAKKKEFGEAGKFVNFSAVDTEGCVDEESRVAVMLNHDAIDKARSLAGFNMLVTSEVSMDATEIYRVYHELWRIEETFRVMKSQIEARPVYLHNPDSIKGHFLICYLAVLLLRLVQVKILDNRFGSEQIIGFIRKFRVIKSSEKRYINVMCANEVTDTLEEITALPINNYYLTPGQLDHIMNYKLKLT